jgi:hypothetical protein
MISVCDAALVRSIRRLSFSLLCWLGSCLGKKAGLCTDSDVQYMFMFLKMFEELFFIVGCKGTKVFGI